MSTVDRRASERRALPHLAELAAVHPWSQRGLALSRPPLPRALPTAPPSHTADRPSLALSQPPLPDRELAEQIDEYYVRVHARVQAAGGHVVKFIGDGALVVFHRADVDAAVECLLALKAELDDWFGALGWACRPTVKVHVGEVMAGPFNGTFDVIGREVNAAAMLDSTGVALSVPAFRALGAELRARFRKHTPPVTYIRLDDPRRFRYRPA